MLGPALKALLSLLLAVVMAVSFYGYLASTQVNRTFLNPDFYTATLEEERAYERIRTEAVEAFADSDQAQDLRSNLGASREEIQEIVEATLPRDYLRGEIDGMIENTVLYLRGDADELEILIDFSQPRQRAKAAARAFIDARVDSLDAVYPRDGAEFAAQFAEVLAGFESGRPPAAAPLLRDIPAPQLALAMDGALEAIDRLPPRTASALRERWPEIRPRLLAGDADRQGYKLAAWAVAAPRVDDFIAAFAADTDAEGRLDVIQAIADDSDATKEETLGVAEALRAPIRAFSGSAGLFLTVMALACAGLGALQLPHRGFALLWPSVTLLVTGVLAFILAGMVRTAPALATGGCEGASETFCDIAAALLREGANQAANGVTAPALAVMAIGGLGIAMAVWLMPREAASGPTGAKPPARKEEGW